MKATITNIIKEQDRIRVFVSFDDGTEKTYLHHPDVNKDEVRQVIKETLREKQRVIEKTESLAALLINQVITI